MFLHGKGANQPQPPGNSRETIHGGCLLPMEAEVVNYLEVVRYGSVL